MNIYNLNKDRINYIKAINTFKNDNNRELLNNLSNAVDRNKGLSNDDFGMLYYIISLMEQKKNDQFGDIAIATMDDIKNINLYNEYSDLKQNLYITYMLIQENGRDFLEGSLRFSDREYKEMNDKVMNEIKELVLKATDKL